MQADNASFKVNGEVVPARMRITWSTGSMDGAVRTGYVFRLGSKSYLWDGSSHVQELTDQEARGFTAFIR
jgi:hypothetical protein